VNRSLSIITPIYNSTGTMKQYLDAVFASSYKDFELIIIDDESDDNPQELIKDYKATYLRLDKRGGSARARNKGAGLAKGTILLFVDPDVIIRPDTLERIVGVFEDHAEVSGLICSYDDSPGSKKLISQFKFLHHHFIHSQGGEYADSFWTGCGAIKKTVFDESGGFDTDFLNDPNTINDIELGYRLKHKGHRIYNAKHIQVKHLKELGFIEWIYTDIFNRGLPWMKIMLARKDFSFKLNVNSNSTLSVISVWATVGLCGLAFLNKIFFIIALVTFGVFLISNYKIFNFFVIKRGYLFSIVSVPLLFIYYLYCGLCAIIGVMLYLKI